MKDTKQIPVQELPEDDSDDMDMEDCPCDGCPNEDYCDRWEAQFCCTLCHWYGCEHCDDCDPMDI